MGNMGLALQKGAILKVLAAAGNLPPQDLTLTPKRDPKSAPRPPKGLSKTEVSTQDPKLTPNRGPKSAPRSPKRTPQKRKYRHRGGNLILHNY